jgi:hypothetical protein
MFCTGTLTDRHEEEYLESAVPIDTVPVCATQPPYTLRIGSTTASVAPARKPTLVPDTLFFNIPKHTRILEAMLKDLHLGEHLLLIGNQGVGKNKLVDKLLMLLHRERDYIQLHRDTTVQSLTLAPSIKEGVVVFEDSALVSALTHGHMLVVDEFDKASFFSSFPSLICSPSFIPSFFSFLSFSFLPFFSFPFPFLFPSFFFPSFLSFFFLFTSFFFPSFLSFPSLPYSLLPSFPPSL